METEDLASPMPPPCTSTTTDPIPLFTDTAHEKEDSSGAERKGRIVVHCAIPSTSAAHHTIQHCLAMLTLLLTEWTQVCVYTFSGVGVSLFWEGCVCVHVAISLYVTRAIQPLQKHHPHLGALGLEPHGHLVGDQDLVILVAQLSIKEKLQLRVHYTDTMLVVKQAIAAALGLTPKAG